MEDRASLRGQGFTLLVFAGLVALCSVFFILGMMVGRGQAPAGIEPDSETAASSSSESSPSESSPEDVPEAESDELAFYDTVTRDEFPAPETPAPPAPAPPPVRTESAPPSNRMPLPDTEVVAIMLQVGAYGVEKTADNVVAELRDRSFNGMVLRPAPGQEPALYRVQVGPFASEDEAARVRGQLLDAGYEVITVR